MFQIIGAIAEFERSLIQERAKAGLRNRGRPNFFSLAREELATNQ
jgi:DNA invertase Pin-like site-specific DNA recombinase